MWSVWLLLTLPLLTDSLTKVVVPSVYKEWWTNGSYTPPSWVVDPDIQRKYNYTVFVYQKVHPSHPNYIATNRGRENGPFYRYIVDNYEDFPDVAVFVHADPAAHQPKFLEWIGCIHPNSSYLNINNQRFFRSTGHWHKYEVWVEQCFRDTLKLVWNASDVEMHRLLPPDRPIWVSFYCCQQFIISREMVRRRPLSVWKQLQHMLAEADVCHDGEPEYESLHAYTKKKVKTGPEPSLLPDTEYTGAPGTGRITQAVTSEHLAHVIFGYHDLDMEFPTMNTFCSHFYPRSQCPESPCIK